MSTVLCQHVGCPDASAASLHGRSPAPTCRYSATYTDGDGEDLDPKDAWALLLPPFQKHLTHKQLLVDPYACAQA